MCPGEGTTAALERRAGLLLSRRILLGPDDLAGYATRMATLTPDPRHLVKLAHARMPFGKYKGRRLLDLPEPYLVWFAQKGFPKGEIGRLLQEMHDIKVNGLEVLLRDL